MPGVVLRIGEEPHLAVSLVLTDGRASQVLVVRDPEELVGLRGPAQRT